MPADAGLGETGEVTQAIKLMLTTSQPTTVNIIRIDIHPYRKKLRIVSRSSLGHLMKMTLTQCFQVLSHHQSSSGALTGRRCCLFSAASAHIACRIHSI